MLFVQDKYEECFVTSSRVVESLRLGLGASHTDTASALFNMAGIAKKLVCMFVCVHVYCDFILVTMRYLRA